MVPRWVVPSIAKTYNSLLSIALPLPLTSSSAIPALTILFWVLPDIGWLWYASTYWVLQFSFEYCARSLWRSICRCRIILQFSFEYCVTAGYIRAVGIPNTSLQFSFEYCLLQEKAGSLHRQLVAYNSLLSIAGRLRAGHTRLRWASYNSLLSIALLCRPRCALSRSGRGLQFSFEYCMYVEYTSTMRAAIDYLTILFWVLPSTRSGSPISTCSL